MNECPDCGSLKIEFESGHPDSFDEPGQPDMWFCNDCGWTAASDFYDRMEDQADDKRDAQRDRDLDSSICDWNAGEFYR